MEIIAISISVFVVVALLFLWAIALAEVFDSSQNDIIKVVWILLIVFVPFLGVLAWWIFRRKHYP